MVTRKNGNVELRNRSRATLARHFYIRFRCSMASRWHYLFESATNAFRYLHSSLFSRAHDTLPPSPQLMCEWDVSKAAKYLSCDTLPSRCTPENGAIIDFLHPSQFLSVHLRLLSRILPSNTFTEADVHRKIKTITFNNASGPDGLRPGVL